MSDTPASHDPPLLHCEQLRVDRGRRRIIDSVSLELRAGEVVALLGPNGAGKSTLLDALAGALPATAGRVERRGRIGIALQSPDLARRSVLANVVAALAWWGVPRTERVGRAREALIAMGAEQLGDRPALSLSGGERRRVHLARALAVKPDVLMLDEPFAGLDAATRASLLDDTGTALRSAAAASLVVVHDRAEAWALADRLLILLGGRLVAEGPPRQLLERPPTPDVARFLGFDGKLSRPGGSVLLTRAQHVAIEPGGELSGRVSRLIPLEDGIRVELELDGGRLYALTPLPGPAKGDTVSLRIDGGVEFPAGDPGHPPAGAPAEPVHSPNP